jgi:regulatory protein
VKTVTDIREGRGRQDRYEIVLDGAGAGTLSSREISDLRLRVGSSVNSDLESRVQQASRRLAAYDRAVSMLARGPRSMFDLRRRLRAKGDNPDSVRWALARLEREGTASDESFALQFCRARLSRGLSRSAILTGLLRVAVSRDVAEGAITQVLAEEQWDEHDASRKAAAKKIRSLSGLDKQAARRRLTAFLRRRGFGATAVRDALDRFKADEEQG